MGSGHIRLRQQNELSRQSIVIVFAKLRCPKRRQTAPSDVLTDANCQATATTTATTTTTTKIATVNGTTWQYVNALQSIINDRTVTANGNKLVGSACHIHDIIAWAPHSCEKYFSLVRYEKLSILRSMCS